eukprot:TRINITY_DN2097_c0_g1_i1.p1 TRINITY_DN2097_c0_g1~~TRINITY_DN2097_c0_g1_i1.p1  ORF type:complete len:873 (-),score=208.64 TRINITY_DN2097_c0_g1_i1:47-2665(-)
MRAAVDGKAKGCEAFFAGLPENELTPQELALREALVACVRWCPRFPLTQWIDRRIGGEFDLVRNDGGEFDLQIRGASGGTSGASAGGTPVNVGKEGELDPVCEAFFKRLPANDFSPQEEALREAVLEFFAAWRHRDPATLSDMVSDPGISRRRAAFLPKNVPLKDWVDRRIGGEVKLRRVGEGAAVRHVAHLSPAALPYISEKCKELAAKEPLPKGIVKAGVVASAEACEAVLAKFPESELLETELEMRAALLEFLNRWDKSRGSPTVADALENADLRRRQEKFLPKRLLPTILESWIERRIGGEVEIFTAPDGRVLIGLLGAFADGVKGVAKKGGKDKGGSEKGGGKDAGKNPKGKGGRETENFFTSLPADELLETEVALRQALLDYFAEHAGEATILLTTAIKDPAIAQARSALLPADVPLRLWIEERIGADVEVHRDENGRYTLVNPAMAKQDRREEAAADRERRRESFFETLPPDGFLPEEEALRQALLDFVNNYRYDWAPSLGEAGGDSEVRRCKASLLPKGSPASLKEWIERRVGGEIATMPDPNDRSTMLIGLAGELETLATRTRGDIHGEGKGKKGKGKDLKGKGKGSDEVSYDQKTLAAGEEFFATLPQDGSFSDGELVLRQALSDHLTERMSQDDGKKKLPARLADVVKDPLIAECISALLPSEVPVQLWIDERMGTEFQVWKDDTGRTVIETQEMRQQRKDDAFAEREKKKEDFFASLPSDGFNEDEERMREAILTFLERSGPGAPSTSELGADPEVKKCRQALLPYGSPPVISMRDWIDRRIGGEVETMQDPRDGQILVGFAGELETKARKRKVDVEGKGSNKKGGKDAGKKGVGKKGAKSSGKGELGPPRKKLRGDPWD